MPRLRALLWIAVSSEKQAGDKVSLVEQERSEREWAEANDYEVVGVLSVPGESRSETDVLSIFEDFAAKNVFAYHDLRRMWQSPRQFDVLVAYHDSRLGRSEALFAYVVTNVMRSGAKIYTILGGWYVPDEYQMKMFMGMASVTNEMKRFVALTKATNLDKAKKGTRVHGLPHFIFAVERDERGRPLRKVVDESMRPAVEAAARLVIEGVGWRRVEEELTKLGYLKHGVPFRRYAFYFLFHSPAFYGHEVITHGGSGSGKKKARRDADLWVFDPSYPAPPETDLFYNVLPPYFPDDSEIMARLKNEMRRRRHSIRGSARSRHSHKFTGLLACWYCGRNLVFHAARNKRYPVYICHSKYDAVLPDRCMQTRAVGERVITAWFDAQLQTMLKNNNPEFFLTHGDEDDRLAEIERLEKQRQRLEDQMNRAIDEQLAAQSEKVRQRMRLKIEGFASDQEAVERQITVLQGQQVYDSGSARQAFEQLVAFPDLNTFWNCDDTEINQLLHGLLGGHLIVVKDRLVEGVIDRPR